MPGLAPLGEVLRQSCDLVSCVLALSPCLRASGHQQRVRDPGGSHDHGSRHHCHAEDRRRSISKGLEGRTRRCSEHHPQLNRYAPLLPFWREPPCSPHVLEYSALYAVIPGLPVRSQNIIPSSTSTPQVCPLGPLHVAPSFCDTWPPTQSFPVLLMRSPCAFLTPFSAQGTQSTVHTSVQCNP